MRNDYKELFAQDNISILQLSEIFDRLRRFPGPNSIILLNKDHNLRGVISKSDIVSMITKYDANTLLSAIPLNPCFFLEEKQRNEPKELITEKVRHFFKDQGREYFSDTLVIPIVENGSKKVSDLIFYNLSQPSERLAKDVSVIGLGYVGLTLSVALADAGFIVDAVDKDINKIEACKAGECDIHEAGLAQRLRRVSTDDSLRFDTNLKPSSAYIICVGTPLNSDQTDIIDAPIFELFETLVSIGIKRALVILRSTVSVGFTRKISDLIYELTGLKAGVDYNLAFCPERTVEGNAMRELIELPQLVSGISESCSRRAELFFGHIATETVRCSSVEVAEMAKLANNTFRDVTFAFANEIASACDAVNISAVEVIEAANHNYPRNPIARPSPGVGGYCLTKDPIIFSLGLKGTPSGLKSLAETARAINRDAALYPLKILERFSLEVGKPIHLMKIVVCGVAFKGKPETNDVRGSGALDILNRLSELKADVSWWDAVLDCDHEEVGHYRFEKSFKSKSFEADAVLVLNNHQSNRHLGLFHELMPLKPRLLFDGWGLYRGLIPNGSSIVYATMGEVLYF